MWKGGNKLDGLRERNTERKKERRERGETDGDR